MTSPLERILRKVEDDLRDDQRPHEIPPGRVTRTMSITPEPVTIFRYVGPGEIADDADDAVDRAARGGGSALPDDIRARFESSLGADLSGVRVHTGGTSAHAARSVGALAYTHGQDIHFADGQYRPGDPFGLHLLAHEVAHTVQMNGGLSRKAIARNPDPNAAPAAPTGGQKPLGDLLEIETFSFTKPGNVSASADAGGVKIISPPVDLNSSVKVKADVKQEDKDKLTKIDVGAIQNSTASSRIGVYKKGDQVVAEHNIVTSGAAADAQTDPNDDTKRNSHSPAPFYQAPDYIDKDKWNGTALMHDQPQFIMPATMAGGVLTETKGSDSFITAVAAKRDGEILQLRQETWTVPWACQIDPSKTGTGKPVDADGTKDKAAITDDSPIVASKAESWDAPKTVEAAKAMAPAQLLAALVACRSKDADAYKNCVQAVSELKWKVGITVRCDSKFSLVMDDNMTITLKGASGSQVEKRDFAKGGTSEVTTFFTTIFNPEQYTGGAITITIAGESKTLTDTWNAPFGDAGEKEMPGSDKHYFVTKIGLT